MKSKEQENRPQPQKPKALPGLRWLPPLRFSGPALLVIACAVCGVFAYFQALATLRSAVRESFEEQVRLLSVLTMSRIEAEQRNGDTLGIRRSVERLNFDRNLTLAVLVDDDNTIIESTRIHFRGSPVESVPTGMYGQLVRSAREQSGVVSMTIGGGTKLITANSTDPNRLHRTPEQQSRLVLVTEHDLAKVGRFGNTRLLEFAVRGALPVIGFALLIGLVIRFAVYHPMLYLEWQLESIGRDTEPTNRPLPGRGEFSRFSRQIESMARELSERTRALRDSEERFSLAVAGANDGLWDWNVKTGEVYFSPRWKTMLGYEEDELPDRFSTWQELLHPDDRKRAEKEVGRMIREEHEQFQLEFRLRHKSGDYREILSRAYTVKEDGKPVRVVGTHVDLTDLREAERRIRELNEKLEQRVRVRTQQLEQANRELESFAYTVSHDLRAPVRAIGGFSRALEEDHAEKLPEEARDCVVRIRRGADTMRDMIEGLLELSQITRERLSVGQVELSALATEILEDLRTSQPDRKVEIEIEPDISVMGDKRLLRVALANLLSNAWKFSSSEEVASIEFREIASESKAMRTFVVRDNGAGFDAETARKLFQPFQRFHVKKDFEGEGIGLATVHRVITRHGGEIHAKSERGRGASFAFTLPKDPDALRG